jgi:hypothetical protein
MAGIGVVGAIVPWDEVLEGGRFLRHLIKGDEGVLLADDAIRLTDDAGKQGDQFADGVVVKAPKTITGDALKAARREFNRVKPQAWIDEAAGNPGKYTPDQLERMQQGLAPIGSDGVSMEIHHRVPLAEGGRNEFDNFEFMTRTEHRLGLNYKINHPNLP